MCHSLDLKYLTANLAYDQFVPTDVGINITFEHKCRVDQVLNITQTGKRLFHIPKVNKSVAYLPTNVQVTNCTNHDNCRNTIKSNRSS